MITVLSRKPDNLASPNASKVNKEIIEYCGLSTDEKPTGLIVTGSTFTEIDTGDMYVYSEGTAEWLKLTNLKGESGGGGGGESMPCVFFYEDYQTGDYKCSMSFAEITQLNENETRFIAQTDAFGPELTATALDLVGAGDSSSWEFQFSYIDTDGSPVWHCCFMTINQNDEVSRTDKYFTLTES